MDCNQHLQWFWSLSKESLSLFPLFPHLLAMRWWDQMPILYHKKRNVKAEELIHKCQLYNLINYSRIVLSDNHPHRRDPSPCLAFPTWLMLHKLSHAVLRKTLNRLLCPCYSWENRLLSLGLKFPIYINTALKSNCEPSWPPGDLRCLATWNSKCSLYSWSLFWKSCFTVRW